MAGAKILKQLLFERNMNVNELAERLGIKPQSILYRQSTTSIGATAPHGRG